MAYLSAFTALGVLLGFLHDAIRTYTISHGQSPVWEYILPDGDDHRPYILIIMSVIAVLALRSKSRLAAFLFWLLAFWAVLFIPQHIPLGSWGHYTDFHDQGTYVLLPKVGDGSYIAGSLILFVAGTVLLMIRWREVRRAPAKPSPQ